MTKKLEAIFTIKDGRVHLDRTTDDFPPADFKTCIKLLQEDLDKEYDKLKQDKE